MIRRLVVLLLLVGGATLIEPLRVPTEGVIGPATLLSFGILLLTADTLGQLAHDLRLPRLLGGDDIARRLAIVLEEPRRPSPRGSREEGASAASAGDVHEEAAAPASSRKEASAASTPGS